MGHPFAFTADANTLLPLVNFIKNPILKKSEENFFVHPFVGGGEPGRFRTCDLLVANETLSHLSYGLTLGGDGRT